MKEKGKTGGGELLQMWQWNVLVLSTLIKLLLVPSYHSTDFEVHRHWLALTRSLPLSQWYFDETSQWTLDYPPFFAYFSWLLSLPAKLWDDKIVDLHQGLRYDDWTCVSFMRVTVIATELVLATALFALSGQGSKGGSTRIPEVVASALLLHPGLLIIDHIHFQYNGFLYGILLWSIWAAREGRPLLCAFLFSSLLNFKHIYIYIAPAYFAFLLQSYVIKGSNSVSYSGVGERLFTLATITLIPFGLSVVPLALSGFSRDAPAGPLGILSQMFSRLFPFSRGINHAYWAANVWALYTFADRLLVKFSPSSLRDVGASASRGIIGDTYFTVLPHIAAGHCFLLTLVFTLLFSARLLYKPTQTGFLQAITLFGLTSFLFGFHVHEKAILLPLIPLTLLAPLNYFYTRMTLLLSTAGVVALFPLLYQARETPIKMVYSLLWFLITFRALFTSHFRPTPSNVDLLVHSLENVYLAGFVPLQIFVSILHPIWTSGHVASSTAETVKTVASHGEALAKAILSTASASASHATATLASMAASWASNDSDRFSHSTIGLLGSAGEVLSSEGKAVQDQVMSALVSAVEVTKEAVMGPELASESIASPLVEALHQSSSMHFLPLMLTSVYCALGVTWVWCRLGYWFMTHGEEPNSQTTQITVTVSTPKRAR